ncbi:hypothetical protein PBY51_010398 [Eleginops maclovinus]|uniref:Uncharacterized protein n=1 Tax=Eleginops maclovinus TaxID=56733 RepID=A0AAN7X8P8_ELEMC|nr:hypothetical protein PBY51_010398 [Eleginops maclovinus]
MKRSLALFVDFGPWGWFNCSLHRRSHLAPIGPRGTVLTEHSAASELTQTLPSDPLRPGHVRRPQVEQLGFSSRRPARAE